MFSSRHFLCSTVVGVIGLLAFQSLLAQDGPPLSPRNANYTMQVKLNPETKILEGTQTIRWRNISQVPANDLWFHLYYNAWRNSESTWLQEEKLRRQRDFSELQEEDWGIHRSSLAGVAGTGRKTGPDRRVEV